MPDLHIGSYTVVDAFAGIGGLSLGFEMVGCRVVAAIESNPHHAAAYKRAHESHVVVFERPVEEIRATDIFRLTNLVRGDLDFLVGGPPCQPFSFAGRRYGAQDARGGLVWEFADLVRSLQPRVFVLENVVGLQSIHEGALLRNLTRLLGRHYSCRTLVLDAAEYGVPQHRRRLFLIGSRDKSTRIEPPIRTHSDEPLALWGNRTEKFVTVRDAISDLPGSMHMIDPDERSDSDYLPYRGEPRGEYQRIMRRATGDLVSGNGTVAHFDHIVAKLERLREGATDRNTRYRRLYWDRPAYTLRAGSGTFTALRPIHPKLNRVITVREAARLQSFPDHVEFSPVRKWAYQQIGNSVPPLLGRAIASMLLSALSVGVGTERKDWAAGA